HGPGHLVHPPTLSSTPGPAGGPLGAVISPLRGGSAPQLPPPPGTLYRPLQVDFDASEAMASSRVLATDVAELIVSLARVLGPERPLRCPRQPGAPTSSVRPWSRAIPPSSACRRAITCARIRRCRTTYADG